MDVASRRLFCTLATAGLLTVAAASPASAETVTAPQASDRSCAEGARGGASVGSVDATAPGTSFVSARLSDAEGNWDLAVIDEAGRVVAKSAFADGDEIAEGFAPEAGDLRVQACRRTGSDPTATIAVEVVELTEEAPRYQLVRVATPTDDAAEQLAAEGFDLTEHGGPGFVDVVLHGPVEGALLNDLGFDFDVVVPDLAAQSVADRTAETRAARRGAPTGLPSGRTGTYRALADYSQELQELASDNKRLVRYFTLKHDTYSGRPVEAIEISHRVRHRDGRPVLAMFGVHHAREWPSGEHTIEYAYELVNGWNSGKKPIRKLLRRARVIFVPIVNPDGFNLSREAGNAVADGGRDAPAGDETANLVIPSEYHRKNCRYVKSSGLDGGNCNQTAGNGVAHFGVDPNRNYGGFWGGPGAATGDEAPLFDLAADYRGPGPFSEPETQNVRELVSRHQVTTLITNHTFSNLVLHPPGLQSQGKPRDDKLLKRLSDSMAAENGYTSQRGYELYDTSGTTEDWSYNATSGLGYTFEIGPDAFHPTYSDVADEYRGNTEAAGAGGGNRAAYMKALRSTKNAKRHSIIRGKAPKGAYLTLTKKFKTPTSPVLDGSGEEGDVILLDEKLKSRLHVRKSGRFSWHVNPSTRPIADPRYGSEGETKPGKPSDPVTFNGGAETTTPCADFDTEDPSCWNDHPFRVKAGQGIDNGTATIEVTWPEPLSDWDMKVFRDTDKDGSSEGETNVVGSSGNAPTTEESATVAVKRGKYVVRVINYAAASPYEGTVTFGKTENTAPVPQRIEKYTLKCSASKNGKVLGKTKVMVDRGERVSVDFRRACGG